jgi:hypothetical protein
MDVETIWGDSSTPLYRCYGVSTGEGEYFKIYLESQEISMQITFTVAQIEGTVKDENIIEEKYWQCWIRKSTMSILHYSGYHTYIYIISSPSLRVYLPIVLHSEVPTRRLFLLSLPTEPSPLGVLGLPHNRLPPRSPAVPRLELSHLDLRPLSRPSNLPIPLTILISRPQL